VNNSKINTKHRRDIMILSIHRNTNAACELDELRRTDFIICNSSRKAQAKLTIVGKIGILIRFSQFVFAAEGLPIFRGE